MVDDKRVPPKTRFGNFSVLGAPRATWRSWYVFLLDASWWVLAGIAASGYLITNALFAFLYTLGGDCISGAEPGSFADAFYFSVQSISTIGYGVMAPQTTYAHMIVTLEAFVGLIGFAVGAGLVFAKFARPTASLLFADRAVVHEYNGTPQLSFRVANWRGNDVVQASVTVALLRTETSSDGEVMRRLFDLPLVRDTSPLFKLSWTVMHEIDERSPLYGIDQAALESDNMMVIVTLMGLDESYGQMVYARHVYHSDAIGFGERYVDTISTRPDGVVQLDLTRFHDTTAASPTSR